MTAIYLLFSLLVHAEDSSLQMFEKGKYQTVQIKKVQNVRIANCKSDKCLALKALKDKPKKGGKVGVVSGNPSSAYCWDMGGKPRILKDKKGAEVDYCVFKDNSMIDGWDLFYAHNPQQ